MDVKTKIEQKIKLRRFNRLLILLTTGLCLLLLAGTVRVGKHYRALLAATREYSICTQKAAKLGEASSYLTTQVELYIEHQNRRYMDDYFAYIEESGGRLDALEGLAAYADDGEAHQVQAVRESVQNLITIERYAMRLVAEATGIEEAALPEQVQQVQLAEADAQLGRKEKLTRATRLMNGTTYLQANANVQNYTTQVAEPLLQKMQLRQSGSIITLNRTICNEFVLIVLLVAANGITFAVLTLFVVRPLDRAVAAIERGALLQETGVGELRYLAHTYNALCARNRRTEQTLRRRAEVDPVTGIMNRNVFQQTSEYLAKEDTPLTLLLVDVDNFKQINDTHGHGAGDAALRRVAGALMTNFRTIDCVARIGGDEFAVLMRESGAENREVIRQKVAALNRQLASPEGALPAVSLSIGCAFSAHGYSRELFERADRALYCVKQNGRCGCAFEDDEAPTTQAG